MLEASYYYPLYLFLVTVLTIFAVSAYANKDIINNRYYSTDIDWKALFLSLFLVTLIGLRPISAYYFCDTANYDFVYNCSKGRTFQYDPSSENVIWDNLFNWWASENLGITSFFVLIAFIYFVCTLLACKRFFGKDQYIAFIVFLGSFSTFSYATNGIKAGAAAAIFLLGLSYYRKWIVSIVLVLISLGFHHSMIVPVAAYIIAIIYKNPKVYFYVWIICLLISALHITFFQSLLASLASDKGDQSAVGYLQSSSYSEWGGKSGFRIDFIIYSAMPILIGYIALFRKKIQLSNCYIFLLNIYLITNSVWLLCMYARYNNRIAYLSWLLFPIILIYPFIKEKWSSEKYSTLSKIVLANLGFTLFMQIIYYS